MPRDWRTWFGSGGLDLLRSLSRPVKIIGPVLILAAAMAAYLTASSDDDVTSVAAEALHSSTLPLEEDDPEQDDPGSLWLGADGVAVESEGALVESLGSPSTLREADGQVANSAMAVVGSTTSTSAVSTSASTTSTTTTSLPTSTTTEQTATSSTTTTATTTTATTATAEPTTIASTAEPTTTTTGPSTQPPTTAATECRGNNEFERVFRDDFNGDKVSSSWRQYHSPGNAGFGLRRESAITVENGRLIMTAQMVDGELVSGGMAHRYDQTYGKYVFRVRVDADPDLATSAVVLTWPESEEHPRDGENNIYESLNYDVNRDPFFTVIHKPYGAVNDHIVHNHNADGTQFQTMTMEWRPDGITITREGPGYAGSFERWVQPETGEDWIPDVAHHLTIQLDAWKHSISAPVRMEVDFAEVYQYCG